MSDRSDIPALVRIFRLLERLGPANTSMAIEEMTDAISERQDLDWDAREQAAETDRLAHRVARAIGVNESLAREAARAALAPSRAKMALAAVEALIEEMEGVTSGR